MNDLNIFDFTDYKDYLRQVIKRGARQRAGVRARMAEALEVPASFVSQVLNQHIHFTLDHAYRFTSHMNLPPDERDYFLAMVQRARAGSRELQDFLKSQMDGLRKKNLDLATKFKAPQVETSANEWLYYSNWHLAAIHMALTIPTLRTPRALAERFTLPVALVDQALKMLTEMGLAVESSAGVWRTTKNIIHLSRQSPASPANHVMWRQKAYSSVFQNIDSNLHYTCLHTLSRKDLPRVRAIFVDAISQSREIIHPSPEEELICVNLDVFTV